MKDGLMTYRPSDILHHKYRMSADCFAIPDFINSIQQLPLNPFIKI